MNKHQNNEKPPRHAKPGKVWMKVLVGIKDFIWVERNAGGPDDISSTRSREKAKDECVVRTVVEMSNHDPFQNTFEKRMRSYAAGGMTKYQKGGKVLREWLGKKRKH